MLNNVTVTALGVAVGTVALGGCQPGSGDMPGLVVWGPDDETEVVVAVCEGDPLYGVVLVQGDQYGAIDLETVPGANAERDALVTLTLTEDTVATGAIAAQAEYEADHEFQGSPSFSDLFSVKATTARYELYSQIDAIPSGSEAVWTYWEYPYGRNDPAVEETTRVEGEQRLRDWCRDN